MGVGKSLLSCRAAAGRATGFTQNCTHGGIQALGTLARCWGMGAGLALAALGTGEERKNMLWVGFPRAQPSLLSGMGASARAWLHGRVQQGPPWHHPAQN